MQYNSIALYNIETESWLHLASPKFGKAQYYWGEWGEYVYKLDTMYNKHSFISLLQTLVDHKMLENISEGVIVIVPMKLSVKRVSEGTNMLYHTPVWSDSIPLHEFDQIFN